eukprot:TRINITY_DN17720_c0_g1_i4.p1 TRINITY_DN17720_c0_g1~~TRINITY_DN17720_c0_g1_i4.p1  ORF type:complete len:348 (+),score=35.88 TRINITY_DN17720_c0_g1_i4:36-1079(+)
MSACALATPHGALCGDDSVDMRSLLEKGDQPPVESTSSVIRDAERLSKSVVAWTLLGCMDIFCWSAALAVSRVVSRSLGALTSMGICFFVGGGVATMICCIFGLVSGMFRGPFAYYLQCGIPCAAQPMFLYVGFHWVVRKEEVVVLTDLFYLWPQFMSIITIATFGNRWRFSLLWGLALAIGSVLLVNFEPCMSLGDLFVSFVTVWPSAVCVVMAAFCWAFYSVRSSYFATRDPDLQSAVPLFTTTAGLGLLLMSVVVDEPHPGPFDATFWVSILFMVLGPVGVSRLAWDCACRRGNLLVLTSFAYLAPCLATAWNILLLGLDWNFYAMLGSVGLVIAAIVAKLSIV